MADWIRSLHGQLVILDVDLAALFGVMPERLNALIRNRQPPVAKEFAFTIGLNELRDLRPDIEALDAGDGTNTRFVYTEHGVLVAGALLDDPHAVQQSIHLVRAFVARRERAESERGMKPRAWLH
jgi:hypothetical protein